MAVRPMTRREQPSKGQLALPLNQRRRELLTSGLHAEARRDDEALGQCCPVTVDVDDLRGDTPLPPDHDVGGELAVVDGAVVGQGADGLQFPDPVAEVGEATEKVLAGQALFKKPEG